MRYDVISHERLPSPKGPAGQVNKALPPSAIAFPGGTPEITGPAIQVSNLFKFQSYFDQTLLHNALQSQPANAPIVPSTLQEQQLSGYAIGLSPSSQTPVAVSFRSGRQGGASTVFTLKPGQVVWPHGGLPFSGFKWGLPFGWLGGGMATIYVLLSPNADVRWFGVPEVIFHRATFAIKAPSDLTSTGSFNNAPNNWPMRFPWTQALQGSSKIPQQGNAQLAIVQPTKIVMVLRGLTTLAAPALMRIIHQATNDYGLNSSDAAVLTNPSFEDVDWPQWTSIGTSGHLATQNPVILLDATHPTVRVAADDGGVLMLDASGAAAISGNFVDVVRYGLL